MIIITTHSMSHSCTLRCLWYVFVTARFIFFKLKQILVKNSYCWIGIWFEFWVIFKNVSISQYRKILLLQMSGVSWWLLCSGWASDCFWGRLSWPEICRWLCLVVVCPVDYQAFFFICLAATRKRHWLEAFNLGRFRETVYQVFILWVMDTN